MRWGLYGDDQRLTDWLQRFARSEVLPSFLGVRGTPAEEDWYASVPRVESCDSWELLLVARPLDAILCSGTGEDRQSAIRQLLQADVPLYLRPHAGHGLSFAYELTLNSAERTAPVRPLWPHRADPVLSAVQHWLQSSTGVVQHVELQRKIALQTLPEAVDLCLSSQQLDDFDILAWLGVRGTRITALKSVRAEPQHRRQTVTVESDSGPYGLWMAETHDDPVSTARLNLHTTSGAIVLEQTGTEPWRLVSGPADLPDTIPPLVDDQATWDQAVVCYEWVDGVTRSLERRRAVELHVEPVSERLIFKTQMAALGCFVLMGTLVCGLGYLLLAAVVPLPEPVLRVLRVLVFAPLFLFLLAQLLLPLTRSAQRETTSGQQPGG